MKSHIMHFLRIWVSLVAYCVLTVSIDTVGAHEFYWASSNESHEEIDRLFAQLNSAPNKESAESLANQISELWLESGSDTIALLMNRAGEAMRSKDYSLALDLLDAVIRFQPKYAEGWSRRATALFLQENYELSIMSIEQALALEPRHWEVLSVLATIMKELNRLEDAMKIYQRILEIYPLLETAKLSLEELELELLGEKL